MPSVSSATLGTCDTGVTRSMVQVPRVASTKVVSEILAALPRPS